MNATPREPVVFRSIGVIRSRHVRPEATPVQPVFTDGAAGTVEIYPEYRAGLKDLAGFSHLYLFYVFDRARPGSLRVTPYLDDVERGVFATRHPDRPNPLGMSIVRLDGLGDGVLAVSGIDVLDGTPLLDIKPYVPQFDHIGHPSGGWTAAIDPRTARERGRRREGKDEA